MKTEVEYSFLSSYPDFNPDEVIETLPLSIQNHCRKHKNREDFLCSVFAWNRISKKLSLPSDTVLKEGKRHKPLLDGMEVNVSHSHDMVAIVYASSPCGIDVELIQNRMNMDDYADRLFSFKERFLYSSSSDKALMFASLWTKKEAYLKMIGQGILLRQIQDEIEYPEDIFQSGVLMNPYRDRYCVSFFAEDAKEVIPVCF